MIIGLRFIASVIGRVEEIQAEIHTPGGVRFAVRTVLQRHRLAIDELQCLLADLSGNRFQLSDVIIGQ